MNAGTPLSFSFGTTGDGMTYRQLNSNDDELCSNKYYPTSGTYRLSGAFYASNSANDEVYARIEPNPYAAWDVANVYGQWVWATGGAQQTFDVSSAGNHLTCIKGKGTQVVNFDALFIEKM